MEKNIINNWIISYKGARWARVDFHLHSPGSHTFCLPSGLDPGRDRQEIVNRYVQQLVEQNMKIIAITDYNGIRTEWYELIREKAQKKEITVLPGVELSFDVPKHGLHIIAVFPKKTDIEAINRTIDSLDKSPANPIVRPDGTFRDINPDKSVEDILRCIRRELNAVLIVAHPNDDNGLFKTYAPKQSAQFLRDVSPDAIENFSVSDTNRLVSTSILSRETCEQFACVDFSDAKSIEDIGTKRRLDGSLRATYLKLSVFDDLEAIRLALHEPKVRVCIGDLVPSFDYTRMLSIKVEGSGFCGGLELNISPELNVIIGGRGVGKSALLELIRYALGLDPYATTEYREELVRYALGSGGKIILQLKQFISSGVKRFYRIERVYSEPPRVFELGSQNDVEHEVELEPRDILGDQDFPLFFGQREIYEVTRKKEQRLRLLDEVIGRLARDKQRELRKLEEQLGRNARDLLDLRKQLGEKDEAEQRLKEIEHRIELYIREGLMDKLRESTLLAQDEEYLQQMMGSAGNVRKNWQELSEYVASELHRAIRQARKASSANKRLLEEASQEIELLNREIEDILKKGMDKILNTQNRLNNIWQNWKEARYPLDEELQKVKQALGTQALDPDDLERLTREQTRIKEKLERLDAVEKTTREKERERKKLLQDLRGIRYEIFRLRQQRAEELTNRLQGRVRVKITYKGGTSEFTERLRSLLSGSGVDSRSIQRIGEKEGIDGQQVAEMIRAGVDRLREELDLSEARANQVLTRFQQHPELLYDLEILAPEDRVDVFLMLDDAELPLEKLSDGQKATAMLLLLLTLVERLLVVDQPEDDLDNRFIYDDIVRILREQKSKRQIIVATHNPNIPVLGDAELVVALEAQEGKARIGEQGSVDKRNVREMIKSIMEGGEEAFRRRAEKYGWPIG